VRLEQRVPAAAAAVGGLLCEMLRAVDFDDEASVGAPEVCLRRG
jgi:hypothetical protein